MFIKYKFFIIDKREFVGRESNNFFKYEVLRIEKVYLWCFYKLWMLVKILLDNNLIGIFCRNISF